MAPRSVRAAAENLDGRAVQPVTNRFTDRVIPAHSKQVMTKISECHWDCLEIVSWPFASCSVEKIA
jgi:hypothetical protein